MRLSEIQALIERFGSLATLGEVGAALARQEAEAARTAPRALADSDRPKPDPTIPPALPTKIDFYMVWRWGMRGPKRYGLL